MAAVVLDCSALLRAYVPDGPLPTGLEEALEASHMGEVALFVPEILLAEAAQVLWKKERAGLLTPDESDTVWQAILMLPLEITPHRDLLAGARDLARQTRLTIYDALYLALSWQMGAPLLTADTALAKAATSLALP